MQDKEFNFFDQEYFESLESKDKYDADKTPKTKEKNISAQDLNDPDLNYIDELVFRSNNPNSSNPAENITIENAEDYANVNLLVLFFLLFLDRLEQLYYLYHILFL